MELKKVNKKPTKKAEPKIPKYELLLDLKWIAEGAGTAGAIADALEALAEKLRRVDELGILPDLPVQRGQTMFESNNPAVKKLGFDTRPREQLRELEAVTNALKACLN